MVTIQTRSRAILLADSMGVRWISNSLDISGTYFRREYGRGGAPAPQRVVNDHFRYRCKHGFGKRLGLGKEGPRPVCQRELRIGALPYRPGRKDVENCEPGKAPRMIKRHAIGDATATIVSSNREARKP